MLCLIPIVGGLLIMMGQHDRCEALFYYFRLEDQVPENHLLRLIEKHISFEFVRERLRNSYSETGRPSIDPELLLRILLIGYLYGIPSERKLVEELRMHLAWRWFTGLGFDQEISHHSTFSKNRHGRFQESKLFEISRHPHPRTFPATCSRLGQHARLRQRTTGKEEGRSAVRGTEESDRTSSPTPAEIKVCSRAVLHGSGCAKHQTIGSLPQ